MAAAPRPAAAPDRRPGDAKRTRSAPVSPPLRVVLPRSRRRRAGVLAGVVMASLFGVLFALAAFQTKLAQDQLRLDRVERDIREAQQTYERLRGEVARLEAPAAVVAAAGGLGLVPPDPAAIRYVTPSPSAVAAVVAATGAGPDPQVIVGAPASATTAWSDLKPVVSGAP